MEVIHQVVTTDSYQSRECLEKTNCTASKQGRTYLLKEKPEIHR